MNRHGAKLPSVAYGEEDKSAGGCCGGHGPGGHEHHGAAVVLLCFSTILIPSDSFCVLYLLRITNLCCFLTL